MDKVIVMSKPSARKRAAYFGVILILLLAVMIGGLRILESTVLLGGSSVQVDPVSKTITKNGVSYFPKQDITVVMLLGTDQQGTVAASDYYRNESRCDVVMLLILDHTKETYTVLNLNRDTMVTMPALGIGGKQAGTHYGQLALSHTYGDGLEQSCENTLNTVSGMLHGINIDYYVAVNMDAISLVNDSVGGVTVNVTDDFSEVDPSITKGEITLRGEQAFHFVHSRWYVSDHLNVNRMERHREYMSGLMDAIRAKNAEDPTFIIKLYETVAPYMVTDCSVNTVSGIMDRCTDYTLAEIVSPEGKNVTGEEYYEFYPDEKKLDALVLRLFYAKKK